MGEVRNGNQTVRKFLFSEIFYGRQAVFYEDCFSRITWVGGVKTFPSLKISSGVQSEDLERSRTIQEFFSKKDSWFYMQRMCTLFG